MTEFVVKTTTQAAGLIPGGVCYLNGSWKKEPRFTLTPQKAWRYSSEKSARVAAVACGVKNARILSLAAAARLSKVIWARDMMTGAQTDEEPLCIFDKDGNIESSY